MYFSKQDQETLCATPVNSGIQHRMCRKPVTQSKKLEIWKLVAFIANKRQSFVYDGALRVEITVQLYNWIRKYKYFNYQSKYNKYTEVQ